MILDELESKQRYTDYLREIEQEQLYRRVRANRSKLYPRVLMRLGDLLITTGQYLLAILKTLPSQFDKAGF